MAAVGLRFLAGFGRWIARNVRELGGDGNPRARGRRSQRDGAHAATLDRAHRGRRLEASRPGWWDGIFGIAAQSTPPKSRTPHRRAGAVGLARDRRDQGVRRGDRGARPETLNDRPVCTACSTAAAGHGAAAHARRRPARSARRVPPGKASWPAPTRPGAGGHGLSLACRQGSVRARPEPEDGAHSFQGETARGDRPPAANCSWPRVQARLPAQAHARGRRRGVRRALPPAFVSATPTTSAASTSSTSGSSSPTRWGTACPRR